MLVPIKWLKDYVDFDITSEKLSSALTMSGSNVESIIDFAKPWNNIIAGKVLSIDKHSEADKLYITKVDIGNKTVQIVTGADNIKINDTVPIALHGTSLPNEKVIKSSVIRGVNSEGMMCSSKELNLESEFQGKHAKDGIMILPSESNPGDELKNVLDLDDKVIEFEITTNRPDCLSIIGLARETAATIGAKFRFPKVKAPNGKGSINSFINIKIDDHDLCYRYIGRMIDNIKLKDSPFWMQKRLKAAGVRPINNIVDITNYVMLEFGQPLHAFDYDCIEGSEIIVRRAKENEKLVTLDNVERKLDKETLVIADSNQAIGIAGIMGGANTEVSDKTKRIVVESANFNNVSVRLSAKKLGLRTEASSRFEKGLDMKTVKLAIDRFLQLIEETNSGEIVNGEIDILTKNIDERTIDIIPDKINCLLGTSISNEEMTNILKSLDFEVLSASLDKLKIKIPSFRNDINRWADIAEEIGRIYGYDNIKPTLPKSSLTFGKTNTLQKNIDETKILLNNRGLSEVITYSFVSPKVFDKIRLDKKDNLRNAIKLLNPLGEDYSIMRTTLIPNLIDTVKRNLNRGIGDIKIFEMGRVYQSKTSIVDKLPEEDLHLGIVFSGNDKDFYDLKGIIELLIEKMQIRSFDFLPIELQSFHPGRTAELIINGQRIGVLGEIHPDVLRMFDIDKKVYLTELNFNMLVDSAQSQHVYKQLPKFPSIVRDVAIVVEDQVLSRGIVKLINEIGGEFVEKVDIFDVYKGRQIPDGYKSIAYSITFRAHDKTLKDDEINPIYEKIVFEIKRKFNAELRG